MVCWAIIKCSVFLSSVILSSVRSIIPNLGLVSKKMRLSFTKFQKRASHFLCPVAIRIIAHFFNIIASADVRFCAHFSAIREAAHSVNIRNHHPIVRIYKHLHKPLVDVIRIQFQEIHKVGKNHQSLDMMGISCLQNFQKSYCRSVLFLFFLYKKMSDADC